MSKLLAGEITRYLGIVILAITIGLLVEQVFACLFLATLFLFILQWRRIIELVRWLDSSRSGDLPEFEGVWGEVFNQLYRMQQRNKKQKQNLAAALTRFQQVSSALPDGAILLYPNNEIEWCNEAAKRLLGIRLPHDVGQQITNLLRNPEFAAYLYEGEYDEPLEMVSPQDDSINLSLRIVPYGKDQKLILARDMTQVLRLEQTRKDFVANVSHELRTPLTVLSGYLEVLDENDDSRLTPWKSGIHAMRQQTARMQNIVEDLLLLSKLESRSLKNADAPVNVGALLREIRDEAQLLSGGKQHQIELDIRTAATIEGNFHELHSAISNVVSNAVRYTPDKGKITIAYHTDENGAHVSVTDTGIGIASHDIPRLTERFYRADTARSRATGGTGLGLAIVKHVLNRHDAHITISSQIGQGSTFTLHFPPQRVAGSLAVVTKAS